MIRVVTIEREYASGGPEIATHLADRLGWKLWDELLTAEIARLTKCAPEVVEQRGWRRDPLVYRVFKAFLRGSYEGSRPPTDQLERLDAQQIATVTERVVQEAAAAGNCVIVGRGSQYFLKNREDVFRIFLYAPLEEKTRRLVSAGKPLKEAVELVDTIDRERGAFIKQHFGLDWPDRSLYHLMLNTSIGVESSVEIVLGCMRRIGQEG
jgi:hypothetical protein